MTSEAFPDDFKLNSSSLGGSSGDERTTDASAIAAACGWSHIVAPLSTLLSLAIAFPLALPLLMAVSATMRFVDARACSRGCYKDSIRTPERGSLKVGGNSAKNIYFVRRVCGCGLQSRFALTGSDLCCRAHTCVRPQLFG